MPKAVRKPRKRTVRRWTREDYAVLRRLAKEGLTGEKIAKKLKRTKAATYQRAAIKGISLGRRSRSQRK